MAHHAFVFSLCLLAFTCLALSMERHQEDLWGRCAAVRTTRALRAVGWAALLAALTLAIGQQGWGFGLVNLFGHSSASAALVLLALVALVRRQARPKR